MLVVPVSSDSQQPIAGGGQRWECLRHPTTSGVLYRELMQQIRNAPSPGSAMAGRNIRLLCSLLPSYTPPPDVLGELHLLCAEIKATPEGCEPAVRQSLWHLEEVLGSDDETRTCNTRHSDPAIAADVHHSVPGAPRGTTSPVQYINLLSPQIYSSKATALHGPAGAIFGVDLRKTASDNLVCDVSVKGSGPFVPLATVDIASELAQRRQFVTTYHAQQQLNALLDQSGSALVQLVDCVLGGSAADRQQQRAAASSLCDKLVDMYCVTQQDQRTSNANGKGNPTALQVPAQLILPTLQEMLEQPDMETRVIACEVLINIASGISRRASSRHAPMILAELVPVMSEVLLLLYLLGEDQDSVWSAAVDALLYFGIIADYSPVSTTTRFSETMASASLGMGLVKLGLMRGNGGTPHRVDPRVLVAMLARPQLLSSCVESSVVARFLVGLLVAGLRAPTSTQPTAHVRSGFVDDDYLEAAGGITVIGELYAECNCVASAELLFAVLYDFAVASSTASNFQLHRTGTVAGSATAVEEARAFVLELLSYSQVAWCFRRVFGCLLAPATAAFEEQMQRAVSNLSRELVRKDNTPGAIRWQLSETHIDLWRATVERLRELVLSTLARAESKEWEAVMASAMVDKGQLATQHERASSIRRLTMLLESSVPRNTPILHISCEHLIRALLF